MTAKSVEALLKENKHLRDVLNEIAGLYEDAAYDQGKGRTLDVLQAAYDMRCIARRELDKK